jgi:hypothetical protein
MNLILDWDERLPLFLLAYRVSSHKTAGKTLTSIVFVRGAMSAL